MQTINNDDLVTATGGIASIPNIDPLPRPWPMPPFPKPWPMPQPLPQPLPFPNPYPNMIASK